VDVGVDQAGNDRQSVGVDDRRRVEPVGAADVDDRDPVAEDADVGRLDLVGEDVDQPAASDDQVERAVAPGRLDERAAATCQR
jgi:hypothetical protein